MLQLYFIRHAQSTNNAVMDENEHDDYLLIRQAEPDLTSLGEKQITQAAEFLARPGSKNGFDPQNRQGFGLTHLYCSLMVRAVKTGQAISEQTGLPLVALPEVHETGGIFKVEMVGGERRFIGTAGPGRGFFQATFPDLVIPEDLPEDGWWNKPKEPRENFVKRAKAVVDKLIDVHGGQDHRVGIVMHGGIFTSIMTAIFDIQAEKYWFLMNNCGISRIDVRDDGFFMLAYLNKVNYLPDHLIT